MKNLTNEEVNFLKEGNQVHIAGWYDLDDELQKHTQISNSILEKALDSNIDLDVSGYLELVFYEKDKVVSQWYTEDKGTVYL